MKDLVVKLVTLNGDLGSPLDNADLSKALQLLLNGHYKELVCCSIFKSFFGSQSGDLERALDEFIAAPHNEANILLLGVFFLHLYVQWNFTGPALDDFLPIWVNAEDALAALEVSGLQSYALQAHPEYLVIAKRLLQCQSTDTSLNAGLRWWRARSLLIHQSVMPETVWSITEEVMTLLTDDLLSELLTGDQSLDQQLALTFHLEQARNSIVGDVDTTKESILKANEDSGLQMVLTGCKAKMTQYQKKATATLTVLAKSSPSLLRVERSELGVDPNNVKLNDDLFLERPVYDSVGDEEYATAFVSQAQEDFVKRIKMDFSGVTIGGAFDTLLPIIPKEEDIPKELSALDPNNQPALANLDAIQLMLRMQYIQANTPSGDVLINEELIALVQRILFCPANSINWLIYSQALWWRSLLETARSRTVERGVLQLYSLVEELGTTSDQTARLFPKTQEELDFPTLFENSSADRVLMNALRLRYIHLLPPMPKWSMDDRLAQKLMELGSIKSALQIYERLEQWIEVALCYAAMDDATNASKVLEGLLEKSPGNARAWSILGDVQANPEYWTKAWELGRYAPAKRSLAKFYHSKGELQKAIDHMFDCLSVNPIDFNNWYFYGCMGLEQENYQLAAEAFMRCITLDDDNSYAWSNLSSSLMKLGKVDEAFHALQKAVNAGDTSKKSWKIWENYLTVAVKLGKWDEAVNAMIVLLESKNEVDLPILERLIDVLVSEPYNGERQSHFQRACVKLVTSDIPRQLSDLSIWRLVAKVNLWTGRPWLALEDYEKGYRSVVNNPELPVDAKVFEDAVDACSELVSAYENFGEMEGRHGAGDLVCKDWKYKAKSSIRSLVSKSKASWEYTDAFERLQALKEGL